MGLFDFIRKITGATNEKRLEEISRKIEDLKRDKTTIDKKTIASPSPSTWYMLPKSQAKQNKKREFSPPSFGKVTTMAALLAKRERKEREKIARIHQDLSRLSTEIQSYLHSNNALKAEELLYQASPLVTELRDSATTSKFDELHKRLKDVKDYLHQQEVAKREEEERIRLAEIERQKELQKQREEHELALKRQKEQEAREYEERLALLEREHREEIARLTATVTQKKTSPDAYINHLRLHGVRYFYHFTDENNLSSIRKTGGLCSWHYCQRKGINILNAGGDSLSRSLDKRYGLEDYVRLSFCSDHPMAYRKHLEGAKLVLLKIKVDVASFKDTMFSDMNATDSEHSHGSGLSDLQNVNIDATRASFVSKESPLFHTHQAECMVKTFIPIEYIENINNPQKMLF